MVIAYASAMQEGKRLFSLGRYRDALSAFGAAPPGPERCVFLLSCYDAMGKQDKVEQGMRIALSTYRADLQPFLAAWQRYADEGIHAV